MIIIEVPHQRPASLHEFESEFAWAFATLISAEERGLETPSINAYKRDIIDWAESDLHSVIKLDAPDVAARIELMQRPGYRAHQDLRILRLLKLWHENNGGD